MKKTVLFSLVLLILFSSVLLPSCIFDKKTYTVAVFAGVNGVTDRFVTQGSYAGVEKYCKENNVSYNAYSLDKDGDTSFEAFCALVDDAAERGAKLMVFSGDSMVGILKYAIEKYPKIFALAVDITEDISAENLYVLRFHEEEAAFLAGYTLVLEGYENFGFASDIKNDITLRYVSGLIQGIEKAICDTGSEKSFTLRTHFFGEKTEDEEIEDYGTRITDKVSGWYSDGCQIVMVYGFDVRKYAISAAGTLKGKLIGCDMDQAGRSEKFVTSAAKSVDTDVYVLLNGFFENYTWDAFSSRFSRKGVDTGSVFLPKGKGSFRFTMIDQLDYEAIYLKLRTGEFTVSENLYPVTEHLEITNE